MPNKEVTACLIIIGNEILSGRTEDQNINWLTTQLTEMGINTHEVRVVADVKQHIIDTVRECSAKYDYIFTTGGIGPTHDDITAESLAEAFNTPLEIHPHARTLLEEHYGDELTEAQLKMARIPIGAEINENPLTAAPAFRIHNVYVLAGIPSIMRAMFDAIKHELQGGAPTLSKTVSGAVSEGKIAAKLENIQHKYPDVDIGSYPFIHQEKYAVSVVIRGLDEAVIDSAIEDSTALMVEAGELIEA